MDINELKRGTIRKAYIEMFLEAGELAVAEEQWGQIESSVNPEGWIDFRYLPDIKNPRDPNYKVDTLNQMHPKYCYWKRPESLRGFENNNGWTRIMSKADIQELANTDARAVRCCHIENKTFDIVDGNELMFLFEAEAVTHYVKPTSLNWPIY